ncbi:MAG: Phasin protein [Burkholderiales bacterium]|jgi:phasin family protein|nr:Phasin protein [Burkholderiales bacterium]
MTQPQVEMFDLYRAGLKSAADILKASLESAERLQNQNLVAIRTAIVEQSKSLSELGEAKTLDELMALQARIAGEQFQRTMGYWTNLCQTAGQNQLAVIGQMQAQAANARELLEEAAKSAGALASAVVRQPQAKQESRKSA